MEDLFESIVGAVYIDSGKSMDVVTRVVSGMLDMSVYEKDGVTVQSAKNALQEWCADKSRRLPPPVYKTLGESGPDHKKVYSRGVFIGERLVGRADGKNQKTADAEAARAALELLMKEAAGDEKNTPTRAEKTDARGKESVKSEAKNVNKALNTKPKDTQKKQKASKGGAKPDNKTAATPPPSVILDLGDLAYLKKYAREKGCPPPAFHDLGIVRLHNGDVEYKIECELAGKRATGSSSTRTAAREAAISAMRELVSKRQKSGKTAPRVKKSGKKQSK
jgi:dsRNA-specific ribonuclease